MQTNEARLRIVHSRGQGEGGMTDEGQAKPPLIALSRISVEAVISENS
jgi:hypothetical protein